MTEQTVKRLAAGKKVGGRPMMPISERLPEGWQQIILDLSAEGASDVEIRAHLCLMGGKFNHDAWYTLERCNVEFAETLKKAEVLCEAWWINQARKNLKHGKENVFETALWFINMKNRFGARWQDKTEIKHSGNFTFTALAEAVNNKRLAIPSNN